MDAVSTEVGTELDAQDGAEDGVEDAGGSPLSEELSRLRVVVDQVASLTDVSAAEWHGRLVHPPRH